MPQSKAPYPVPGDTLAISILLQEVGRNAALAPEPGKEEEGQEDGELGP